MIPHFSQARDLKAKIIVGKFSSKAKDRMGSDKSSRLKHRIRQWSVVKLMELLKSQPVDFMKVSEAHKSSVNPFTNKKD